MSCALVIHNQPTSIAWLALAVHRSSPSTPVSSASQLTLTVTAALLCFTSKIRRGSSRRNLADHSCPTTQPTPRPERKCWSVRRFYRGARWNRTIGLSIIRETVTPYTTRHNARIYLPTRSFVIRRLALRTGVVYHRCMSRTNIDIDEDACRVVMLRYHLATKREAVNFALRTVAGEPLSLDKARGLRGSGWDGDLEEMRASRTT